MALTFPRMDVSDAGRLKAIDKENRKLKTRLQTASVETTVTAIERDIERAHAEVARVFIEAQRSNAQP